MIELINNLMLYFITEDTNEAPVLNVSNSVLLNTICKYVPFILLVFTKFILDNIPSEYIVILRANSDWIFVFYSFVFLQVFCNLSAYP